MSTEHTLYGDDALGVEMTNNGGVFDLDLYGYPHAPRSLQWEDDTPGPQGMTATEALSMAAGIIYAVWTSHPDEANLLAARLADQIPGVWNQIVRERAEAE